MRIAVIVAASFVLTLLQGCTSVKVGLRPFPEESELEPFSQRWAIARQVDQTENAVQLADYRTAAQAVGQASMALEQARNLKEAANSALEVMAKNDDQAPKKKADFAVAMSEFELRSAEARIAEQILKSKSDAVDPERRVNLLRKTVSAYSAEIYRRAKERSVVAWEANEMATFGGMGAVIGGIASKTGLINTGAAVATLGLTNSQFYKLETQRQSYITALKRLSCISAKMAVIAQQDLDRAMQSTNIGAGATAATNFESTVVYQVDAVRTDYINALLGIAPAELDRATLEQIMAKYTTGKAQPFVGPPATGSFTTEESDAAATKVKEASDAVLLCTKT